MIAGTCSSAVKVQLHDACGAPIAAAADVPLALSSSSTSLLLFSDDACTSMPFNWSLSAATSEFDLYVQEPTPGMPTLQASSAGLDGGSLTLMVACPSGQKVCNGACIPNAGCCDNTDCMSGGLAWVCNGSNVCVPPPCSGFPANCTVFDDRTGAGASRTVTFDSSGYAPKCMRVSTTQDVTFSGSFAIHPLQQVCGPSDARLGTTSGVTKTARFSSFGTYGYRCANHPAFEQGAIKTP